LAEAENAAAAWWAKQSGLEKIMSHVTEGNPLAPQGGDLWAVTIVYKAAHSN
jgi:hypothetical protein